ncbi:MAG TPA: glycogen synthase GlgA [Planctomycetaceae bacterium]|nr:glycogen synthase GlgA [Planctomycetaceae bacterium]
MAASEAYPFSKTGGLADVAGSLSRALNELGHEVWLFVPHYRRIYEKKRDSLPRLEESGLTFEIAMGSRSVQGELLWTQLPHSDVSVLMIDQPDYFDRNSLYVENGQDYGDNCERFCFFSRAVMEVSRRLLLRPNVIHANDWQTGLLPVLLDTAYRQQAAFRDTISVMSIHNLAFQGRFWHWDMQLTGVDWKYFNWEQMESYGQLNLMKSGLVFADKITTVSPTYAREIQTEENGYGLDGLLRARSNVLTGILNGIDDREWNPALDPALPVNYNRSSVIAGKAACKEELQSRLQLPERPEPALFGMVSRLTDQKGLDLIVARADAILSGNVQMVFLGSGDPYFENKLREIQHRYPEKVSVTIGYDEALAHLIEAGSDIYLMPSRFEPCGLNQLYSLKYGTLPIVHKVGGLADSVCEASDENLREGTATGIVFDRYDENSFQEAVERALALYNDRTIWYRLMNAAMQQNFSWKQSAEKYLAVYQSAIEARSTR